MKRAFLIAGIFIGIILMLGPLWGLLGTVIGMREAFISLGQQGIGDPSHVSKSIGGVLVSSVAGLVACPIGVVLLVVCIFQFEKARRCPPPLPPGQR